jgi:peptidyl-tRNA hydrolase
MLHTDQIPRLRLGVRTSTEINDLVEYVLEPFNKRSLPVLEQVIEEAVKSLRFWLQVDIQRAMSYVNSTDLSE